jgi:signal transduction histidine kinase
MNSQREFMEDAFHLLAQPVTALRVAMELGLSDDTNPPAARKTFADCLGLLDRLMQELAIFREIASLDAAPALAPRDGEALLKGCVEEMAPVAEACGVALDCRAAAAPVLCDEPLLQRAIFLLLDEMIACATRGGRISIRLSEDNGALRLELRPGAPGGRRQQLCRKLLQFAGGSAMELDASRTLCLFRNGAIRHEPEDTSEN